MRAMRCGASYSTIVRALGRQLGQPLGARPARCAAGTPRTRSAPVGSPLTTSAATSAAGPGHGRHVVAGVEHGRAPAARPGSLMPGVPASVTTATSPPSPSTASTSGIRAASVCSLQTASRTPLTPAWASSRPVRRVSSQQISAAPASAARGPRRQVAEVADRAWRRGRGGPSPLRSATGVEARVRPVAELDDVADRQAPPLERAGLGLDHPRRLRHREPDAVAGHAHGLDDASRRRRRRPRRAAKRIPTVCTQRHGRSTSAPSKPSRCEQPAAPGAPVGRHLCGREHVRVAHQPAHVESMPRTTGARPLGATRLRSCRVGGATRGRLRPARHRVRHRGFRVPGSILGERVIRKEDPKFLTSGGKYLDDLNDVPELAGAAHVVYVRSAVAHGTITSIDTSEAAAMPGVLGVFTAADLGLEPAPSPFNPTVARTLLASDRVRYVGEPIAAVVAETAQQATDAAEAVVVDYDVARRGRRPGGGADVLDPPLRGRRRQRRVRLDRARRARPDRRRVLRRLRGHGRRGASSTSASPRARSRCAARPRRGSTAGCTSGCRRSTPRASRASYVASNKLEADQVRVITPDVGGGFGAKIGDLPRGDRARRAQQARSAGRCAGPRRAASR